MIELIIKMMACLIVALVLGFIIGWLLSKLSSKKKHHMELDTLGNSLEEKNKRIETLEGQFVEKETALMKFNDENRELKNALKDKTTLLDEHTSNLTNMQKQLSLAENSLTENQSSQEKTDSLIKKISLLEEEIEGLESVLVKAEETIESKSQLCNDKEDELSALRVLSTQNSGGVISLASSSDNQAIEVLERKIDELTLVNKEKEHSIELYQNTIGELEKELKLYTLNGEEDEFVISKDQFTHIEEQLVEYQKEIEVLKEEKKRLLQKGGAEESMGKEVSPDLDDIAIVKLFRETYKKITKS